MCRELADLERSHAYLTDLVERMSIPVFSDIHRALECTKRVLEMVHTTTTTTTTTTTSSSSSSLSSSSSNTAATAYWCILILEKIPAKFHPDLIWNNGALGFFEEVTSSKKKNKNKNSMMSSNMRSVPHLKSAYSWRNTACFLSSYDLLATHCLLCMLLLVSHTQMCQLLSQVN